MTFRFKVAAVVFLASLLAAPAVALSNCWAIGGHRAQHSCQPDCPMMAEADGTGLDVQAQPQDSTCCRISPDKTAPTSQLLVATAAFSVTPAAARTSGLAIPASTQAHISETASPPPIAPSQSVLCTFLI